MSPARSFRASGDFLSGTRRCSATRPDISITSASPTSTDASSATATGGRSAPCFGAAATISGEGVSPAASAAARGSPPGSAAATASAVAGRACGSRSRQREMTRSTTGSRSGTSFEGLVGAVALRAEREQLRQRRRLERAPAREELVEDEAQRVDVAARRKLAAFELFGRHVGGRAGLRLAPARLFGQRGDAEVRDAHVAALVDHHVGGLEVAVEHALLVNRGESGAELPRDLDGLVRRQPTDALQERRQLLAAHELHRDEVLAARLAHVVDAAHVAVRNLPRDAHLAVEPARSPRGRPRAARAGT